MVTALTPMPASAFRLAVEKESGERISRCYQCGKCTAGCPLSYKMDLGPRRVMRALQLGLAEEVLRSNSIWLCVQCQMCTGRCPREIDIARVMEACRLLWHKQQGLKAGDRDTYLFHKLLLDANTTWGRMWEPQLAAFYNLFSGHLMANLDLVPGMLAKGKLGLIPERAAMGSLARMKRQIRDLNARKATPESAPGGSEAGAK